MKYNIIDVDEKEIKEKYQLTSLVSKVITKAKLTDEQILQVLDTNTSLKTSDAPCVKEACNRILEAKNKHEKVFVGGDYDTDGICSTAIMKDVLDRLNIENGYYIPDRFKEGYGLSSHTVELAYQKGYTLIVTVDNGVKAFDAIEKAHELGIDIIVTDHHQIEDEVDATIVVHPDYMEKEYKYLSGAGVALELSRNLLGEIDTHTCLAAIALIGDVMPFWLETRVIIRKGIELLKQGILPSVSSLFRKGTEIDETAIAFQVVPKLNSVARIKDESNVNTLVPFLLSNNLKSISSYSVSLNKVNDLRKKLSNAMATKAESMIDDSPLIILYDESFDEGIAGLVAGKLAFDYKRPCIIMTSHEDLVKASGRSIPGFNLFEFMKEFDGFCAFGGHEQAVGFAFRKDKLEDMTNQIKQKYLDLNITVQEPKEDAIKIHTNDISVEQIEDLNQIKPIPKEIGKLKFALERPEVLRKMSYERVTKYTFSNQLDGLIFSYQKIEEVENPQYVIGTLSVNEFRGAKTPQILIDSMEIA